MTQDTVGPRTLRFERAAVGASAIICGIALVLLAAVGPLGTGQLEYRTSESAESQLIGSDIVNVFLIAPILFIGGALHMAGREGSRYWLVLTPLTLFYIGVSYALGQEWADPEMTGNVEQYVWLMIVLVIGSVLILVGSLPMFTEEDAPDFDPKWMRVYILVMVVFLLMFTAMWAGEVREVMETGDTASGSYSSAPTLFWTVRVLDLGITIPFGFLSLYLLATRPKRAYPLLLLFFGFFVTLGTAVNAMGWNMYLNDDPELDAGGLVVFGVLGVLSWFGLLFLVKDKLFRGDDRAQVDDPPA